MQELFDQFFTRASRKKSMPLGLMESIIATNYIG
jgi:hypothetical protein